MQTLELDKSAITISQDAMTAYLRLPKPFEGLDYQVEDVLAAILASGIKVGIIREAIEQAIKEKIYEKPVLIAEGKVPKDGEDGYYDYHFERQLDTKPKINEDGSVNYAIKLFELVTEGQVIAVYHHAVHGIDGFNLYDAPLRARPGRELPQLRGRGFACEEDGVTYVASITGKIDVINDKINIIPVYEVHGDVDVNMGDIDFRGDVIIHGSLLDDVTVRATGTVTIDGVVQGGSIYANKSIVLSGGVLGNGKSVIDSKGEISAKFIEFATVRSKGDIVADVFMDSDVYCEGKAFVMSKKGQIVGGKVHAVSGVETNSIGNSAEISTHILVGNGGEVHKKMEELRKNIHSAAENIERTETILKKFDEFEKKTGESCKEDPRRVQLVRIRVRDMARKAADEDELKKLQKMVDSAAGAAIRVRRKVYPGVAISIDTCEAKCKYEFTDVIFIKKDEKVVLRKLSEWEPASS